MKTFNEKLKQEKIVFDNLKKEHKAYEKKAIPEVLNYLKQFRKENKREENITVYNNELLEYILKKENVEDELKRYLETEIYLAQTDYKKEKDEEYRKKMLSKGFIELTKDTEYRGKILLNATYEGNWMTIKIDDIATLTGGKDDLFIIAKGKRKRGWYPQNLKRAYYKPIINI